MRRILYHLLFIFVLGALVAGCGSGGGSAPSPEPPHPSPGLDTTPPRIISQSPAANEPAAPGTTQITITFSEPIDGAGLSDHFSLSSFDGRRLGAQVTCNDPCTTVALTPQAPLEPGAIYSVAVHDVADLAGNKMTEVVLSFTTQSPPPVTPRPLSLTGTVPADNDSGINEGTAITLTFDHEININTIDNTTFRLRPDSDSTPVPGTFDCASTCAVVTFSPAVQLHPATLYWIEVTSGITDPAGNPLDHSYLRRFTTRVRPVVQPVAWTRQMGNNFNQTLYGIDAVSAQSAWAVGERGLIIHTADGGAHWTLQESGASLPLYGIDFVDDQTGYAVGGAPSGAAFANAILKTSDGGSTWSAQAPPALSGVLKSVRFVDSQKGWAVGGGGAVLTTADGGLHWAAQNSGVTSELTTVDFVDADHGWATGSGKILLATSNGGAGWSPLFTFSSVIRAIDFIDPQKGWAVGDGGALLSTADGGGHWTAASLTTVNLYAIRMTADSKGWAAGDGGTLLYFDGSAWSAQSSGTRISLLGAASPNGTSVWSVGLYGIVTFATVGGANPVIQNDVKSTEIFTPFFVDRQTGWTVGAGARIFKTSDGGANWTQQVRDWKNDIHWTHLSNPARLCAKNPDGTWAEDPATALCIRTSFVNLYAVSFLTPLKGWAVGQPSLILTTENGGLTWTEQNVNPYAEDCYDCKKAGIYLRRVEFNSDGQNGWAIGRFRTIFKTTDGGVNWKELNNNWKFPTPDLTCTTSAGVVIKNMGGHLFGLSVNPDNPNDAWVAGGCCGECNPLAIIAHTLDGGATWNIRTDEDAVNPLPTNSRLRQIQMIGNTGWAVGQGGIFLRTEDGGAVWREVPLGAKIVMLLDLFFIDLTRGWIVGEQGQIFKTEDGGLTWRGLPSGTRNELTNVRFLDDQEGWISGAGDLILHTTQGG